MGGKLQKYPRIVKTLSKVYSVDAKIQNVKIRGHRIWKESRMLPYLICSLKTNAKARELAKKDLEALTSNKFSEDNLKRLSKFSKAIDDPYLKKVRIK